MKRTLFLASALAVCCGAEAAFAQDNDQLIVTATRSRAAPDAVASAMSTITEEDLKRRQTTFVVDALAAAPGVAIAQNGGFGGQASVRIRGAASEQTLVLIDGVAANDPSSPGAGWNGALLDAADVAQIQILRGPQSTLWGSDAIGGLVNIITRRPGDGFSARAFAEAGGYQTLRAGGSLAYGGAAFDARIGVATIDTDGVSKADDRDGNSEADPYHSTTFDGRIGLDLASALRVEAFGRHADSDNAYDGFGFDTGVADSDELERTKERSFGLVGRAALLGGRLQNLVTVSRGAIERRYFSGGAFSFGAEGVRETYRYQVELRVNPSANLVFGAEREDVTVEDVGASRTDSLFLLGDFRASDELIITGGVRRDDHSQFGGVTTGRFGVRWAANDAFGLRASWGQGFKAPTLFQLSFFFAPATGPNLDLQPEKAEGWDAGVFTRLLDGRLSAELGYFRLTTQNLIQYLDGRYENVARAKSEGAEAALRFEITPSLTLTANYTYTDAIDESTGLRLMRVPEHTAFAELDWRPTDALGLSLIARYDGEEVDIVRPANPRGLNEAWARADLAGRYRLNDRIELFARVENVTDEDYQDVFGYGTPGRSFYGGARVRRP